MVKDYFSNDTITVENQKYKVNIRHYISSRQMKYEVSVNGSIICSNVEDFQTVLTDLKSFFIKESALAGEMKLFLNNFANEPNE